MALEIRPAPVEAKQRLPAVEAVIVSANQLLAQTQPRALIYAELQPLAGLKVAGDEQFEYLRSQLETYYEGTPSSKHAGKSKKWIQSLYSSLLKALTELTFTPDFFLQKRYLNRIYHWYLDKTQTSLPEVKPPARSLTPKLVALETEAVPAGRRQERLARRKLDAVKTIEALSSVSSRSASPAMPSPFPKAFCMAKQDSRPWKDPETAKRLAKMQEKRNKTKAEQRLQTAIMRRWGSARSRLDEAMAQRNEMKKIKVEIAPESSDSDEEMPVATTVPQLPFPPTHSFVIKEEKEAIRPKSRSQMPISRLRYAYRHIVPLTTDREELMQPSHTSISLYSQRVNTLPTETSPSPSHRQEHAEVNTLKKQLAKESVACQLDVLNAALYRPTDLPQDQLFNLPSGGEYFTSNPFSSLGHHKKKSSKSKGKKKKKR
jgi:hypothetical protein